ncbi:hypothetical protein ACOMHN_011673 [Nucella lapillus]
MSDSDNPSSPKKEEMDVSENGDASKAKEDSDQEDSKVEEPTKKEEANEESGEDEEEPPLGLLERPVELTSGKREKKKVERLEVTINLPNSERKKVDIPEGKGTKLGDCPRIEFKLNHIKAIDLKPLHRLLYSKAGTNNEVKKNIRQFNGFTFAKGDKEFEKRVTSLNKFTVAELKHLCEVLDIERGGTKSAIVERILDFLMKPSSSGLRVPAKKKRKSKGGGDADKKGAKRKRAPKKKDTKSKASKDLPSDISDSDDNEEDEEEEEEEKEKKFKSASEEEEEEEEEEEPPKKKAKTEKKSPAKKEAPKKEAPKAKKQNGKQEKTAKAEKKEPKKKKKVLDSDEDSDSDDEPLAPKKNDPPNNSELKDVIKKILDGANLEEVTMKTVVKQVYEKYPSFDLADRKDFIKTTVREIIS